MTQTPPFSGRCLCGDVRFECQTAPLWSSICHCESCRRATSSALAPFFGMADGGWRWTGALPATYSSSPGVWRDFCGRCGSPMAYRSTRFPGEIHFYAASLDAPESYVPQDHVFVAEALAWLPLGDDLPRRP